jgi:hypothetical protein
MYCTTSYRHVTSGLINILDLSIVCCFCNHGSLYCPLHHAACACARVPSPIMFSSSAETVRSDTIRAHISPSSFELCAALRMYLSLCTAEIPRQAKVQEWDKMCKLFVSHKRKARNPFGLSSRFGN